MNTQSIVPAFITQANLKCKKYIHLCDKICVWFHVKIGNSFYSLYQVDWRNLMKQSVTVGAQLLWGGRYGCNNARYGCTIVMPYIEINKAVSQWLLTFNLCVSDIWPVHFTYIARTPLKLLICTWACVEKLLIPLVLVSHHTCRDHTSTGNFPGGLLFRTQQYVCWDWCNSN